MQPREGEGPSTYLSTTRDGPGHGQGRHEPDGTEAHTSVTTAEPGFKGSELAVTINGLFQEELLYLHSGVHFPRVTPKYTSKALGRNVLINNLPINHERGVTAIAGVHPISSYCKLLLLKDDSSSSSIKSLGRSTLAWRHPGLCQT